MDQVLARIESFFAIWFNSFKKHVFKVEVTNSKNDGLSLLEKRIGAVVSSLDLVSKQLERSNSAQSTAYLKGLSEKIGQLIVSLKSTKELNVDRLERSVDDLVRAVKRTEVTGTVQVGNFPKVQKVEGAVDVDQSEVLKGLQVLVEAIHDLKIEVSNEVKNTGLVYAGQTGSKSAYKITDGTDNVTITTVGSDKALDVNVVQSVGGSGGGDASAANQDEQTALLTTIDADTSSLVSKDFATQTTLAAINTKLVTGTDIGDVTINNAAGAAAVNIQDGGNTITVDGTVAVTNAGITTIAGAVSGTEMQVDVLTMPTVAVTQSGTWDEVGINDSGNSITVDYATTGSGTATGALRVELPTNGTGVIATVGAVTSITNAVTVNSHNVTNAGTFAVQVDGAALTSLQLIDDAVSTIASATPAKAVSVSGTDGTNARTLKTDTSGELQIDVLTSALPTGASTLAEQQTQTTALQLIDDVIYVDDADWTADTSKHALVGSVTQVAPTANTDGDVAPLISDALRQLRVAALESDLATAGTAHVKKYYTNAGAVTDGIIWSPAAGKRWFLTHLSINVSAAATVTIEDDLGAGDSAVYKAEFAANSGVVLTFPEVPMFSGEDAADLLVTTSAGNVYITAVGYEI